MDKGYRHNLPPRAMSLMWLGLARAPWLLSSLMPLSDDQRHDRSRDSGRNSRFRDY